MTTHELHGEELANLRKSWEQQGFEIFEQPRQFKDLLPLKGYIPDFVLRDGDKYFAVEVVQDRNLTRTHRIAQMRDAIDAIPNWNFIVYFIKDGPSNNELRKPVQSEVLEILAQAERQAMQGQHISALLLAWSTLEAAARFNHPLIFAKPHTPSTLIARLAERGEITPDEADSLREIGQARNRLVHGDYSIAISKELVSDLISIVRALLKKE